MGSWKTYVFLVAGMVLFGSATPISRLVVQEVPVFIAGFLRVSGAFLLLLPFVNLSRLKHLTKKTWLQLILISLVGVTGFTTFLLFGMKRVSGVAGSALMGLVPIVTGIGSTMVFKETLDKRLGLALGLAVVGVWIVTIPSSETTSPTSVLGVVLVLLAIFSESTYTLTSKKLMAHYSAIEVAAFSALLSVVFFLVLAMFQIESFNYKKIPFDTWIYLVWYSLGTMGLGSVLWYWGLKQVEGVKASVFMAIMPLSALVLSYVVLDEQFSWYHLGGFSLVLTALYITLKE